MSVPDYKEMKIKLLQEKLNVGIDQLNRGEHTDYSYEKLMKRVDDEFN